LSFSLDLITGDILAFEHKVEFEAAVDKPNNYKRIGVDMPLRNVKVPIDQREDKIHQYHLKYEKDNGNHKRRTSSSFFHEVTLHRLSNLCLFF
jgi:hypothetical protein